MSLTTRVSIQWADRPCTEPTDTIVITSPENHFVDVRVLKSSEAAESPKLDWAFCGRMVYGSNGKCRYTHDIDSRDIEGGTQKEQDIGYTTVLKNGDERETGIMWNPATRQREKFIEIWRPLNPQSSERVTKPDAKVQSFVKGLPVCVMATVDGQAVNGRLVRVGNWYQAVAEFATGTNRLACVRAMNIDGQWSKAVDLGRTDVIPSGGFSQVVVGQILDINGITWAVIEHNDSPLLDI